jgi:hypothetical protein
MAERRSPRKLRDVSHLFLSRGGTAAHGEPRRVSVTIWLAVAGASTNRAHLAAGLATALSRQGMCVSLLEACAGLPNIGYYFGMEPAAYLAPAIDRAGLESGTWNGSIRFCFSANLRSFARYQGNALPPGVPHAIVAAFSHPREREAARYLAALAGAATALAGEGERSGGAPDAIIAAGSGASAEQAQALTAGMRDAFPEAAVFLAADDPGAVRSSAADGMFVLPGDLRCSWARRVPPADRFFDELAAGLLQVVGQRRKREGGHAANG